MTSKAAYGTSTITITSDATDYYNSATATYALTVNKGIITLNNNSATSAGTAKIYQTYNTNVYLSNWGSGAMTTSANKITVPTKTGYTFGGYYDSTSYTTQYISADGFITSAGLTAGKALKSNGTWYAKWTANTYNIKYVLNSGTAGSSKPTTATYNKAFTVSNPTRPGYTFAGWDITGMDSVTHTYGSATTTSTSISGTKATSFKNLHSTSGSTVTFTAKWAECGVGYWCSGATKTACSTGLTTIGYGAGADEAGDCGRILHVDGQKLYLRSAEKTDVSLHVKIGDTVFFGNMVVGTKNMSAGATKTLKIKHNGQTYSVYDDSVN
jgi:hypothetical protein